MNGKEIEPLFLFREERKGGILYDNEKNKFLPVNHTAAYILSRLTRGSTVFEISKSLAETYRIPYPSVFSRTLEFIRRYGWKTKNLFIIGSESEQISDLLIRSPLYVDFYPSLKCNANCLFCYLPEKAREKFLGISMSLRDILKITNKLKKAGIFFINLLGGEPFLLRWLPDFIDYCSERKLLINITTNGLLPNERIIKRIASPFINVNVSIHGKENSHDLLVGIKGSFVSAINTIKMLKKYGVRTMIAYTVNKINQSDVVEVLSLANSYKVEAVGLRYFYAMGHGKKNESKLTISLENYWRVLDNAMKLGEKLPHIKTVQGLGGFNFLKYNERLPNNVLKQQILRFCGAGVTKFDVFPDGSVYPCFAFSANDKFKTGNLLNQSVKEIWNSPLLNYLRIREAPLHCSGCKYKILCRGGCLGYSYEKLRRVGLKDPRCPLWPPFFAFC